MQISLQVTTRIMKGPRNFTRSNAYKAYGPRSVIGKLHSSRNALKHGLCVRLGGDRELYEAGLQIAHAIAGKDAEDALLEQALIFAETELELRRIRQIQLATIETAIATNNAHNVSRRTLESAATTEIGTADAFLRVLPILKGIERYQRRSYSRRKKALQLLHALQAWSCTTSL